MRVAVEGRRMRAISWSELIGVERGRGREEELI